MELVLYEKINDPTIKYDYAVRFNANKKTFRFFDKFANIIGNYDKKEYDIQKNVWLISSTCFNYIVDLDKQLFDTKKTNNVFSGVIKLDNNDFYKVKDYESIGSTMTLTPFGYQKKAIKMALDKQNAILIAPCGAGKTIIGIGVYIEAIKQNIISNQGLIVVKASLKKQWENEIHKFSNLKTQIIYTPSDAKRIVGSIIRHTNKLLKKEKDKQLIQQLNQKIDELRNNDAFEYQFKQDVDLYIVNYDILYNETVIGMLQKLDLGFIYADEIHYVKNDSSLRAKALYKLNNAKLKFGATATPIQRDPRDIFGLFKFIKPDLFPKKSEFNRFYIKWGGYGRPIGALNESNLNKHINPYMIMIPQEEIGKQLPDVMVMQKYCDFNQEQYEMHCNIMSELNELHDKEKLLQQNPEDNKDELAKVEAGILMRQTFAQELADSEELLLSSDSQVASKYTTGSKSSKIELLIGILEELIEAGEKVCIFSRFTKMQNIITNHVLEEKSKAFKNIKITYINGSLNANTRYDNVYNKFRDDDDCKILICSDAGAEGLNLSWCRYMIEMDLANSYAIQQQRHGRLKRADSNFKTVFVYQLICQDSYDEIAQKIVNKKEYYDKAIINGEIQ